MLSQETRRIEFCCATCLARGLAMTGHTSIILYMTIKTQLNDSIKDAMKSGDEVRKRTIRMALAAVKQAEVDKRIELDDMAIMALLQKEIKNRRESLEEARKAN